MMRTCSFCIPNISDDDDNDDDAAAAADLVHRQALTFLSQIQVDALSRF